MKSLESKYNQIVKSKGAIGNFQLVTCLLLTVLFGQSFAQRGPFSNSEQVLLNKFNHSEAHELLFLENRGQITNQKGKVRKDVLFMARGNGGFKVVVKGNGLSYQFYKTDRKVDLGDRKEMLLDPTKFEDEKFNEETYRVDMHLVGANPKPTIQRLKENGYTESYYNLAHAPEGIHGVKSYEKIVLKDVYPGIDWVIYSQGKGLKYDFIVHPGADFKQIKMRYEGSSALRLQKDGSLLVKSPLGELTEDAPITFSGNKEVKSSFTLENGLLSFDVPNFDAKQTLTIDPTLLWGTYYGGSASDIGRAIRIDPSGNVYIAGTTASTTNIATAGAHQTVYGAGTSDGFIVKFGPNGNRLWGTYYGGAGNNEHVYGLAIDASGNVFATGSTLSATGIATAGSHQPNWAGSANPDAYLVKFNSSGVRQWGTYYGDTPSDNGFAVGVDGSGNVFLAGSTGSLNLIATAGTHQTALAGGTSTDAFLVKFNTNGVRQWGTYYGGTAGENPNDLAIDAAGNIYMGGSTFSTGGIATIHQTTAGGAGDGFIVKFNTNGIRQWGTYYGGTAVDRVEGVEVDAAGNVFAVGATASAGGTSIATAGSFQAANGGGTDGFLVRFNTTGTRQWGTYIGGPGTDVLYDASLDAGSSTLFLVGETASTTNIASAGAYQSTFGGGTQDAYFARFNQTGTRQWSSYFGGEGLDGGNDIVFSAGSMYMTGRTTSTSRISTTGAHQTSFAGGTDDAFLVKISPLTLTGLVSNATTCLSADGQINLTVTDGTAPYTFLWSDGATTQNRTGLAEGTYTVTVTDNLGVSVEQSFTVLSPPIITNGQPAKDLLGQYTTTSGFVNNWTQSAVNNNAGAVNALGFNEPIDPAIDRINKRLFVGDLANHRILVYNLDANNQLVDKTPDFVLGQPNFTTNASGLSATALNRPSILAYDEVGQRLFTTDLINHRVLVYDVSSITNGEAAVAVLGQANFTSGTLGSGQNRMNTPNGLAYDSVNRRLFVSDQGNHRILVYDVASITNGQNAVAVLGQINYTNVTAGLAQNRLNTPTSLDYNPTNQQLFVSDNSNNRVLVFDVNAITNGENAVNVLGQTLYNTNTASTSQTSLTVSQGGGVLVVPSISRLFVSDGGNNRVMIFDITTITNNEAAISVLGQPNFTTGTQATSQAGLRLPGGLLYDVTAKSLFVADYGNNRYVTFDLNLAVTGVVTNANCNNGAITISMVNGTGPYTFAWGDGPTTQNRTGLAPGTYTVTVTDACGQVAVQSFTVAGFSQPTATATFTNINCFGANNGSITISGQTGGSGTYEYRLNTGAWQSSPSFTGLAPGSYLVQIRDAGNPTCESVISTLEITQPASFSANGFVTPVNCFGGSTGSIIQTITGGVAPFTYVWSGSSVTTKDRTNLPAGVYTVTITDANGCQVVRSYEVTQAPALVVTNTVTQPTCGVAGSILLSISGGIAPYTFDWADLSGGNDPQNRSNLAFGSYSVTVTDSRGCTVTQNFTLNDPGCGLGKIICIAGNTADQYSVTPDATIESYTWTVPTGAVIVSGQGTPSIVINWTGATPGPGQICVKTINDCGESQNYCEPVLLKLVNATASSTFACSGGSLQLFGNGGTEYSWTGPNGFTSNLQNPVIYNASTLASGVYTVTVTDEDGCSSVATVNVVVQPGFTLTENIQPATCGLTNGEIDLIITGGTAPFTYAWSNGANTEDLINLPAGIYTVKVTDANGCVVELTGAVGDVEGPSLTASVQNIICNGQFTGSIDLTVLSGTAPYTFLWSNGATTEDISGLRAGVYSVVVVDANGCVATLTQVVNQPNPVQVSAVRVNASCFGTNTGRITLTVSGGTPGFTYSWSDGGPAVSDRTNLAAGSYTVTITDAAGCTTVRTYIISQPNPIIATPTVKNILCAADTNGIISVAVTGGALPLSYSWTGPGGFTATTKDILNLKPGDYTLVITDANGCTATLTRTVTAPAVLAATTAVTPVSCFGTATGSVTLTVTGGTAPFTYLWSNGATTQSLSGVRAGVYAVLITDANGCIATASGVVASPSQLLVGFTKQDVTCFGGTTGQISVSPTGGTGAYTYTWSDGGSTSATRTGLAAGNYTVTVTDANGCTATELITITSNPEILVNSTIGDVNCFGGNNGSITLSTGGGTGTLTYAWADGPTTKDRTNLTAGTYSVTITDALGCSVNRTFTITQPAVLAATGTVQNVLCNGADNGAINLTVTGGVAPFTYAWSSGQSSQNVTGLAPGSYSVVVTDFNLCSVTQSFSVTEPDSIVVLSTVTPNCFGQTNGTIALSVSGGTAPYTYAWTGAGTGTSARFGLGTGTYTVTITDANGCIYTETFVVEPLQVTLSSEAITCRTNDGTITAVVTGGLEPYAFLWSNGATTEDISQLAPGTYSVTVTAGFCTATASVVLAAPTGCLPPTAQSESFTTPFNTPITQTATPTDSLAQGYDSDPVFDLSELIFEEFYGAPDSVGVIVFGPQGDFTFTPAPNFIGSFTWEYTICNIRNACDTAALTITVLPNPILATNDTYGPIVGKTGNSNVGNVLSNDSLAALPATLSTVTLSTVIAEPTGKVTLNPDGTVSVAANTPADTFQLTYRICEILIPTNCDTAVVSVIVTPAPIDAVNDVSTATIEETIGGVAIPDVRTNDRLNNLPIVNADVTIAQEGVWPAGITLNTTTGAVSVAPSVVSGPYSMQYKLCEVLNPTNCDIATVSLVVSIPPYVKLFPRVYLQGSLYGVSMPDTLMRDNLRTLNRLPLSHPYSYLSPITPVAAVNPAVFTVAGANAIVDWVFVELRSKADSTVIVDSRAALLQRDGDIVDIDGTSAVQFGTATNTQQYFVAVRHRNHLGVMTASALTMTPAGLLVDFRKATTPTFRFTTAALNQSQVIVQQGRAMWAGNTARDRQIIYQGTQNDVNPVYNRVLSDVGNVFLLPTFKSRGYQQEDVDMNGESVFQGTGNDLEFIYQNIISNHIGNAFVLPFFTIREQLP